MLIPAAVAAGAQVFAECRVERILVKHGRAPRCRRARSTAAAGRRDGDGARARGVLAGSAVGSAALALASGLPDPSARGQGARLHPGAAIAGIFDEVVEGWNGIPQSWECTEKLRSTSGRTTTIAPGSSPRSPIRSGWLRRCRASAPRT